MIVLVSGQKLARRWGYLSFDVSKRSGIAGVLKVKKIDCFMKKKTSIITESTKPPWIEEAMHFIALY